MKSLLCAFLLPMFAACASEPTPAASAAAGDATMTCEREYRVGSNIPRLICTAPKSEAERQRTLDDLRNQLRSAPAVPRGGVGG